MLKQIIKESPHKSFRVSKIATSVAICEANADDRFNWGNATEEEPAFLVYLGCKKTEVAGYIKTFNIFYRCDYCEARKPKYLKDFEVEIKVRGMQRETDCHAHGLDTLVQSETAKSPEPLNTYSQSETAKSLSLDEAVNKSQIVVEEDEIQQSVENLTYFIINDQNLNENVEVDNNAIADIIKNHLQNKIKEILSDPEEHLSKREMSEVEKFISLPYTDYLKQMNQDIPYSA